MTTQQLSTVDHFQVRARESGAQLVIEDQPTAAGPRVLVSEHFTSDSSLWEIEQDGSAELIA